MLQSIQYTQTYLGLVTAVQLQLTLDQPTLGRHLRYHFRLLRERNINVTWDWILNAQWVWQEQCTLVLAHSTVKCILQQHCDSHWSDPSGNGRDFTRAFACRLEMYVANPAEARLLARVWNSICANVNDHSILLQPLATNQFRLASRGDHNVGVIEV